MLKRLGESEWEIIRLKYWKGLSARQIGIRLGIDHKTVRRRHDAALAKLRAFFEHAFQESTA
jgi:RNA polymerase sigma factor (sigma-70 family)